MILLANFPINLEYYFDEIIKKLLLLNSIKIHNYDIQFDDTFVLHDFPGAHDLRQDNKGLDDFINDIFQNYISYTPFFDDLNEDLRQNPDNEENIIQNVCEALKAEIDNLEYPLKIVYPKYRDVIKYDAFAKIKQYFSNNYNEDLEVLNFILSPENFFKCYYKQNNRDSDDELYFMEETVFFHIFEKFLTCLDSWKSFKNAGYELIRLDKDETFTFNNKTFEVPKFHPDVQLTFFEVKNLRQVFKEYYELFGYSVAPSKEN